MSNCIMFVGSFSFNKEGREGNGYNFVEFSKSSDGKINGRIQTVFSSEHLDLRNVTPGDFVDCELTPSQFLNGKPKLTSIKLKKGTSLPF